MQVAAGLGHSLLGEDAHGQGMGLPHHVVHAVADVKLNRKAQLVGHAQLAAEALLLLARAHLVVGTKVQADLAHAHATRRGQKLAHQGLGRTVEALGAVGVDARHDAHVAQEVRRVPALEGGRNKAQPGGLVKAVASYGQVRVEKVPERRCVLPLAGELRHRVYGHHHHADTRQSRAGKRQRGVMAMKASQVGVGVRHGGQGPRRRTRATL